MEIKDLKPAEGSKRNRKRVGRGAGSGYGKTSGRGLNGQKSRAGGGKGVGFEGGQTPLARRLPKLPGFRNFNRVEYVPVNVNRLDAYFNDGDVVDVPALVEKGIVKHSNDLVKVLVTVNLPSLLPLRLTRFLLRQRLRSKQQEERLKNLAKFAGTSV